MPCNLISGFHRMICVFVSLALEKLREDRCVLGTYRFVAQEIYHMLVYTCTMPVVLCETSCRSLAPKEHTACRHPCCSSTPVQKWLVTANIPVQLRIGIPVNLDQYIGGGHIYTAAWAAI